MRHFWIVPAVFYLAACGPSDRCEVPAQPKLLSVREMSREDRANALGVSTRTVERRMRQAIDFLAARMRGVL